jgi:hypothetical protein
MFRWQSNRIMLQECNITYLVCSRSKAEPRVRILRFRGWGPVPVETASWPQQDLWSSLSAVFCYSTPMKVSSNFPLWWQFSEAISSHPLLPLATHSQHFCGHVESLILIFSFMIILQTVGLLGRVISSSQGLHLNIGQHKYGKNTYTYQTSMPFVGFEPTIPASEHAKTVHALDGSTTVTGSESSK